MGIAVDSLAIKIITGFSIFLFFSFVVFLQVPQAMAQTAGAICAKAHSKGKRKLVYFMTIDGAKFRRPVVPGDQLQLRVSQLKQRRNIFKYDCEAWVGEEKAAEAIISAMMVDPEEFNQ